MAPTVPDTGKENQVSRCPLWGLFDTLPRLSKSYGWKPAGPPAHSSSHLHPCLQPPTVACLGLGCPCPAGLAQPGCPSPHSSSSLLEATPYRGLLASHPHRALCPHTHIGDHSRRLHTSHTPSPLSVGAAVHPHPAPGELHLWVWGVHLSPGPRRALLRGERSPLPDSSPFLGTITE